MAGVVFLLEHTHEFEDCGHDDVKRIGVYSTRKLAEAALARVQNQPGFRDVPQGFSIDEWTVDDSKDGWPQGYVTAYPDGTFSN